MLEDPLGLSFVDDVDVIDVSVRVQGVEVPPTVTVIGADLREI